MKRLVQSGQATNIKNAKRMVERANTLFGTFWKK